MSGNETENQLFTLVFYVASLIKTCKISLNVRNAFVSHRNGLRVADFAKDLVTD